MDAEITRFRGCLALTGESVNHMVHQDHRSISARKLDYHVTLFTKDELRSQGTILERLSINPPKIEPAIDLGLGSRRDVYFKVVFWAQGNDLRRSYGLANKQFHITLSEVDDHSLDKGVNSIVEPALLTPEQTECIIFPCVRYAAYSASRAWSLETVRFVIQHHLAILTEKAFDGAWRLLSKYGHEDEASSVASSYLSIHPDSVAGHVRNASYYQTVNEVRRAMHHYAYAAGLTLQENNPHENLLSICTKGILKCSQQTEFGAFFREDEINIWEKNPSFFCKTGKAFDDPALQRRIQDEFVTRMASDDLDSVLSDLLSLPSNCRVLAVVKDKLFKLPRFFRWLLPFRLALMSTPRNREDIEALVAHNITLVVTLTEEEPLPSEWFTGTPCRNVFIPVRNYYSPTNQQVETFLQFMDDLPEGEAALIHCGGGKGRAGTLAACYLMARGFDVKPQTQPDSGAPAYIFPADAIRILRHMRPGSIETVEQENFIKQYAKHLASAGHASKSAVNPPQQNLETQHPLEMSGMLPAKPSLIVCCGIPGSGKSTFSAILAKHLGYVVISQDELGSRAACLSAMANALQTGNRILIDRCNPYLEDRQEWLAHAFHPKDALCVWFDVDRELCIVRADARAAHPTIAQGRAKKVVMSFSKTFVPPSSKEKFASIARVPSSNAASELLIKLGVSQSQIDATRPVQTTAPPQSELKVEPEKPFIYKFPRTRHLFNLGAATRDDLILTTSDATAFLHPSDPSITITLEEKVDGANLGISIDDTNPSGFKVQNRSHYVNSKSHAQFKKLDKWLDDHREGLNVLLRGDGNAEFPAGRFVLYGEWLFAKHSIGYDRLPDIFLAFDLLDTDLDCFCSREELGRRLLGTGIHQVCSVQPPKSLTEEGLLDVVRTQQSRYYDGILEGLYLRRQQGGKTIDRAKIVRTDFIAGNEHWSRGSIVPNRVVFE